MLKPKNYLLKLVLLFTIMFSTNAFCAGDNTSSCRFQNGYSTNTSVLALPAVINVRGGTAPHTLLWDSGWLNGGNTGIVCGVFDNYNDQLPVTFNVSGGYSSSTKETSLGDGIYFTGLPGVGVKVLYSNSHDTSIQQITLRSPRVFKSITLAPGVDSYVYYPASEYKIQFWSISEYSSGTSSFASPLADIRYSNLLTNQVSLTNTQLVVNLVGCTVQSSIDVDLNDVAGTTFTGVGSASPWKDFSLPMSCYAGTKISTTIDATPDPSGATSVIKLMPVANSATGLGVQLYYSGGTPVVFGQKTLFKSSSTTAETIKLTTRMYQTEKNVTAGKVSAVAYLTMTYE